MPSRYVANFEELIGDPGFCAKHADSKYFQEFAEALEAKRDPPRLAKAIVDKWWSEKGEDGNAAGASSSAGVPQAPRAADSSSAEKKAMMPSKPSAFSIGKQVDEHLVGLAIEQLKLQWDAYFAAFKAAYGKFPEEKEKVAMVASGFTGDVLFWYSKLPAIPDSAQALFTAMKKHFTCDVDLNLHACLGLLSLSHDGSVFDLRTEWNKKVVLIDGTVKIQHKLEADAARGQQIEVQVPTAVILEQSALGKALMLKMLQPEYRDHVLSVPNFAKKTLDELWTYTTAYELANQSTAPGTPPAVTPKHAASDASSESSENRYTVGYYRGRPRGGYRQYGRGGRGVKTRGPCYLCGKMGHLASGCPDRRKAEVANISLFDFYNIEKFDNAHNPVKLEGDECPLCGKVGHVERECFLYENSQYYEMALAEFCPTQWDDTIGAQFVSMTDKGPVYAANHFKLIETQDTGVSCDL